MTFLIITHNKNGGICMKKKLFLFLLLLCIPITTIHADDDNTVLLGGDSIGIEAEYDGVYVTGIYHFKDNEEIIEPEKNIQIKDLIIRVNKNNIDSIQEYQTILNSLPQKRNSITLDVIRNNELKTVTLTVIKEENGYQDGLYMKDKVLGIGTITFYTLNGEYRALGHTISNEDNDYLQNGTIYPTLITSIKKATTNVAGEKNGSIDFNSAFGTIEKNNIYGISGHIKAQIKNRDKIDIADPDEIKLGDAIFYTVLEDNIIESFHIKITAINKNDKEKSIRFISDDERLIQQCGGIIHGMSGSPIVQNGKLIGAVTHVFVNDPTRGYAIFAENMLEDSE